MTSRQMTKVFKKQKMIDRLTREGRYDKIDQTSFEIMDLLDGKDATDQCWDRQVIGQPVLWVSLGNGHGYYVNENDCE